MELQKKYKVKHVEPLPSNVSTKQWVQSENLNPPTYERRCLKTLFSKRIRILAGRILVKYAIVE
jgi:hypothetical protein